MSGRKNSRSRGRGRKQPKKVFPQVVGKVQMTREGFAFIIVEDSDDDVFVKASKTRGALNGDTVRVIVTREKNDRQRREGEVVEILERSAKPFIGVLHIIGNQAWVLMESRFMPYDITIPVAESDAQKFLYFIPRSLAIAVAILVLPVPGLPVKIMCILALGTVNPRSLAFILN